MHHPAGQTLTALSTAFCSSSLLNSVITKSLLPVLCPFTVLPSLGDPPYRQGDPCDLLLIIPKSVFLPPDISLEAIDSLPKHLHLEAPHTHLKTVQNCAFLFFSSPHPTLFITPVARNHTTVLTL